MNAQIPSPLLLENNSHSVITLVPGFRPGFLEGHMRAYAQRHFLPEVIDSRCAVATAFLNSLTITERYDWLALGWPRIFEVALEMRAKDAAEPKVEATACR